METPWQNLVNFTIRRCHAQHGLPYAKLGPISKLVAATALYLSTTLPRIVYQMLERIYR